MNDLCVHPKTQADMSSLALNKPHAILLTGPSGIGKKALSKSLAKKLLDIEDWEGYPYKLIISSDKTIGIDSIREMEHFLTLKVPSTKSPNRIVIIEDAEKLSLESQNALLKTLEEPPESTVILMTLSHSNLLLGTLRSRTQKLNVTMPDENSLRELYSSTPDQTFNQAYLISGGLPGLLHSLIVNEDHPLKAATTSARDILSSNLFERSLMVNSLSKDSAKLMDILQIMEQMATLSLKKGVNQEKWQRILRAAYETRVNISKNAQTKLALLKLMFSL